MKEQAKNFYILIYSSKKQQKQYFGTKELMKLLPWHNAPVGKNAYEKTINSRSDSYMEIGEPRATYSYKPANPSVSNWRGLCSHLYRKIRQLFSRWI